MDYQLFEILRIPYEPAPLQFYDPADQGRLWKALIEYCDRFARLYFDENIFRELLPFLQSTASQDERNRAGLLALGEALPMVQMFPMLSEDGLNRFVTVVDGIFGRIGSDKHPIAISITASVLYETRFTGRKYPWIDNSSSRVAVDAEIASFAAWHTFAAIKDDASLSIESSVRDFREQSQKLIIDEQNRQTSMNAALINTQERHTVLNAAIMESEAKVRSSTAEAQTQVKSARVSFEETLDTLAGTVRRVDKRAKEMEIALSTNGENLETFKTAAYEALKIDSTRKLWDSRARSNLHAFIVSAVVIGVFLLAIPAFALYKIDAVISALERVGEVTVKGLPATLDGAQLTLVTISRLIVISLPIALYFWVIKLLVRFNMRSLMLMDDATQRHTMLDTYFRLIEQDGATKTDRALVLNALFRPLPGSAQESVEPPNFTELIDKATGKG